MPSVRQSTYRSSSAFAVPRLRRHPAACGRSIQFPVGPPCFFFGHSAFLFGPPAFLRGHRPFPRGQRASTRGSWAFSADPPAFFERPSSFSAGPCPFPPCTGCFSSVRRFSRPCRVTNRLVTDVRRRVTRVFCPVTRLRPAGAACVSTGSEGFRRVDPFPRRSADFSLPSLGFSLLSLDFFFGPRCFSAGPSIFGPSAS